MRKFIFPLVLVAAALFTSVPSRAATIYYQLILPTATSWQIWAQDADGSASEDLGINGFGCTLTPSSGVIGLINSGSNRWNSAPLGHTNDDYDQDLGFTSSSASATTADGPNGWVLISQQGANGSGPIDAGILHVGQNAMSGTGYAGNNNGVFLGDTDVIGDPVDTKKNYATGNLAGFVLFFSGTNDVPGSISYASITSPKGAVFLPQAQQPVDPGNYSATATTVGAVALPVPEPASLALLGMGGLMILGSRRRRA